MGAAVITAKGEIDGIDMSGENNPMYGRTGENNPFYGKKHSPETSPEQKLGCEGFADTCTWFMAFGR